MKKQLLFFLPALALGAAALTQTLSAKHVVLYEKFTNNGCGPCARFAPASDSLVNIRLGDMVALTYHGSYPNADDPNYVQAKKDVDARIGVYGITGYPSVIIDGTQISHSIPTMDAKIDECMQKEQTIDLGISTTFADGTLTTKLTAKALKALNNPNLRLFVAVIEEDVPLSKPAPNMQIEFKYVFRHFMQDPSGYDMGAFAEAGKEAVYENSWKVQGLQNNDEMAVVAWIQDMSTKEIVEACYAPKSTDKTDAAKVLLVKDTPTAICSPHYTAKVWFRNLGSKPITSCNVCVNINGHVQKTPWTGNLGYLETEIFTTPDFTDFTFDQDAAVNVTNIYISDINGTEATSNSYSQNFTNSVVGQNSVELAVFTDNKPEETSWELLDADNNVIETSEPFTEKRKFYRRVFPLASDGCYRVRFIDKGGDGIVGAYGNGYYKFTQKTTDGKSKMITQGDFGGAEHNVFFRLANATLSVAGVEGYSFSWSAADKTLSLPEAGVLTIADMAGRTVVARDVQAGTVSLDELSAGVYVVTLAAENEKYTKSIIVK